MTEHSGFGDLLRRHRLAAGLTQEGLAERAGLSARGIAALETGERTAPRKDTLRLLADALGVSPEERATLADAARARTPPSSGAVVRARRHDLPVPATPFMGREREVEAVRRMLERPDVRLLTLTGIGGIGKTRLAVEAASASADRFPDGLYFVSLAAVTDPVLLAPTIAASLGVTGPPGSSPVEGLKAYLAEKRILLILDNFEQVSDASPLLGELLAACSRLRVMVTSRALLRVYGEHGFPVPPMAIPRPTASGVEHAMECDAVRLFVQRARAVRPDFELTEENAAAVAEVCRRLEGLPLAIELAAARSNLLTPSSLLARLGSRLKLLGGGARDLPERQRTIRATLAWSHNLLDDRDRALLRRLSVFAGGWRLSSAEAVCDPDGDLDVLEGVASLVDRSLVQRDEGAGTEPRLRMLETVREYALERLEASGEDERLRRRHAEHYLALAETTEPELKGAQQRVWLDRLDAEHDNLRSALGWALAREDGELALRLAGALWRFWFLRGHLEEGERWLAAADGVAAAPWERADVLLGRAVLAHYQGDWARAAEAGGEALALSRGAGDDWGSAAALAVAGSAEAYHRAHGRPPIRLEEALALARRVADPWLVAWSLHLMVDALASTRREYARASALLDEATGLARAVGDAWLLGRILLGQGQVLELQGDLRGAEAPFRESLALHRGLGDSHGVTWSLAGLAWVAFARGDLAAARAIQEERLALARELGDGRGVADALGELSAIAFEEGDSGRGWASGERGLALLRELGGGDRIAYTLARLGIAAVQEGDYERATRLLEESLTLYRELGDDEWIAPALLELADAEALRGNAERAAGLRKDGLALSRRVELKGGGIWGFRPPPRKRGTRSAAGPDAMVERKPPGVAPDATRSVPEGATRGGP